MVDEFEDEKSVEEYVKELDSLEIEPESSPEGQPLENVVEMIEKQPKQKEVPKKKPIPPPAPVETPKTEPVVIEQNPEPLPEPVVTEQPVEQAIQETPPVEETKPTFYSGIDDFIQKQSEQIELEYANQGKIASEQFKKAAYQNLVAVVTGQVRIVPVEQQQPTPQPSEVIQEKIVNNRIDDIRRIDEALKDPAFAASRKALLKKKCDLLGVDFCDDLIQPAPAPVPDPEPLPQKTPRLSLLKQNSPDNPQLANPKSRWSPKLVGLLIGLCFVLGVAVIILGTIFK